MVSGQRLSCDCWSSPESRESSYQPRATDLLPRQSFWNPPSSTPVRFLAGSAVRNSIHGQNQETVGTHRCLIFPAFQQYCWGPKRPNVESGWLGHTFHPSGIHESAGKLRLPIRSTSAKQPIPETIVPLLYFPLCTSLPKPLSDHGPLVNASRSRSSRPRTLPSYTVDPMRTTVPPRIDLSSLKVASIFAPASFATSAESASRSSFPSSRAVTTFGADQSRRTSRIFRPTILDCLPPDVVLTKHLRNQLLTDR